MSIDAAQPPTVAELVTLLKDAEAAGDLDAARAHAATAIALARQTDDRFAQAQMLRRLADLHSRCGDFEAAVIACINCLELLATLAATGRSSPRDVRCQDIECCRALTTKAFALAELGLAEEALEALSTASELADQLADPESRCWVLNRVGSVHATLGKYVQARGYLLEALKLAVGLNLETQFAALNNLTDATMWLIQYHQQQGDSDAAAALLPEAHLASRTVSELATYLDQPYKVAISLLNAGFLAGLAGDHEMAKLSLQRAAELASRHGFVSVELAGWYYTALLLLKHAKISEAIEHLSLTLTRSREISERPIERDALRALSQAHEAIGNYRLALQYHRDFYDLELRIRTERSEARSRLMAQQAEVRAARLQAADAVAQAVAIGTQKQRLEEDHARLLQRTVQLQRDAHSDPLTGIANRRYADVVLPELFAFSAQQGRSLCVAILDIDHFKAVNDTFGHSVGDQVLARVAQLIIAHTRAEDLVARYGGEEFLLGFADLDTWTATSMCDRLRQAVDDEPWEQIRPGLRLTVSIGIAARGEAADLVELIEIADQELYAAKNAGRNRTSRRVA